MTSVSFRRADVSTFVLIVVIAINNLYAQRTYTPIVYLSDTIGYVEKQGSMTLEHAVFSHINSSVIDAYKSEYPDLKLVVASIRSQSLVERHWAYKRGQDISKGDPEKLKSSELHNTKGLGGASRSLYRSGVYSQLGITISMTGSVLSALLAPDNPKAALVIGITSNLTALILNWTAGEELKKAAILFEQAE